MNEKGKELEEFFDSIFSSDKGESATVDKAELRKLLEEYRRKREQIEKKLQDEFMFCLWNMIQ